MAKAITLEDVKEICTSPYIMSDRDRLAYIVGLLSDIETEERLFTQGTVEAGERVLKAWESETGEPEENESEIKRRALSDALDTVEREAVGVSFDKLLYIYSRHENALAVEADSDMDYSYYKELEIVNTLRHMITSKTMKANGYYLTDATGFSRWEKE